MVLSGLIGLAAAGAETLVRPPALLGELALVAETRRPATATAREPTSVLKVSRTLYRRILAEYPRERRPRPRRHGRAAVRDAPGARGTGADDGRGLSPPRPGQATRPHRRRSHREARAIRIIDGGGLRDDI